MPGNALEESSEEAATPPTPMRDPFLTTEEAQALTAGAPRERLDSLRVTAILYAPPRSRAIVEGRVLAEGDVIQRKQVEQIQPEAVVLKDLTAGWKEYLVELKPVSGAGQPRPERSQ